MHLPNADFLQQLGKLLESSPSSVFVTQKRMPSGFADVEMADPAPSAGTGMEGGQHAVLVRVTDGKTEGSKRVKLATVVPASQLASFTTSYLGLVRSCLSQSEGLKPRTRAKHPKDARKRDQTEADAQKAKRRGAGRRKFQRQEAHKAQLRHQRALAKPIEDAKATQLKAAQNEAQALFAAGETAVPGAEPVAPVSASSAPAGGAAQAAPAGGAGGKKKGKKGKKGGR